MESLAYSIKEINTGVQLYNACIIISPEKLQVVSAIWNRAFQNTDVLYIASSNITKTSKYVYTQEHYLSVILTKLTYIFAFYI